MPGYRTFNILKTGLHATISRPDLAQISYENDCAIEHVPDFFKSVAVQQILEIGPILLFTFQLRQSESGRRIAASGI